MRVEWTTKGLLLRPSPFSEVEFQVLFLLLEMMEFPLILPVFRNDIDILRNTT